MTNVLSSFDCVWEGELRVHRQSVSIDVSAHMLYRACESQAGQR
jgi:hypothetical protein